MGLEHWNDRFELPFKFIHRPHDHTSRDPTQHFELPGLRYPCWRDCTQKWAFAKPIDMPQITLANLKSSAFDLSTSWCTKRNRDQESNFLPKSKSCVTLCSQSLAAYQIATTRLSQITRLPKLMPFSFLPIKGYLSRRILNQQTPNFQTITTFDQLFIL